MLLLLGETQKVFVIFIICQSFCFERRFCFLCFVAVIYTEVVVKNAVLGAVWKTWFVGGGVHIVAPCGGASGMGVKVQP